MPEHCAALLVIPASPGNCQLLCSLLLRLCCSICRPPAAGAVLRRLEIITPSVDTFGPLNAPQSPQSLSANACQPLLLRLLHCIIASTVIAARQLVMSAPANPDSHNVSLLVNKYMKAVSGICCRSVTG